MTSALGSSEFQSLTNTVSHLPLTAACAASFREIDAAANALRLRMGSEHPAQLLAYRHKAAQARACLAETDPALDAYPSLAAEMGITGATLTDIAQTIVAAADHFDAQADRIEAERLRTKACIRQAQSSQEVAASLLKGLHALSAL